LKALPYIIYQILIIQANKSQQFDWVRELVFTFIFVFQTLYFDAVKAFPDDLQSTIDLMDEKELRVRTPLEEIDILMGTE
jgi:hypothetical protein